ncbi:NUDIX domain-containing protein [Cereibacter sphaeroides]|uniref:NUDIX domain-containing protein n=1 Tax=Cereibacter sphaeroides TaxID=1063 RepID=UPI001F1D4B8E|nr:NUDIX domain-containing protein [Cereibacter sphaeroides]MCE6951612.1 NUDIX domain-containing protein [Cereibacter sphaeroides]
MGRAALEVSGEGPVFLCGPLAHGALQAAIFGRGIAGQPARLDGHALTGAGPFAALSPEAGGSVEGVLVDLDGEAAARLDYHREVAGLVRLPVEVGGQSVQAMAAGGPGAGPWCAAEWEAVWAPIVTATAVDVLALWPEVPAGAARARYRLMLVQGASRVRAAEPAPAEVRRRCGPGDIAIERRRQVYANFFAVEEYDLAFRRFGGAMSPTVNRAVFISGDAVTVVPYDPTRDRVLLVEQFRPGPFGRGDREPWLLEPIAGRIDPGETPEATARREAVEEAGLTLGALEKVAGYYPTPAAKAEFLYSYVALADLPDGVEGVFGVEGEAEDIRGHLIPFDRLMDLVRTGEICNGPLVLTALWLERERPRLRAESR